MRKQIIIVLVAFALLVPGCSFNKNVKEAKAISIWWGTKEEIKTFLDRPEAKAKRWVVESVGE